ncbi:MAG: hypothetical protein KJI70_00705 [Patescibacteria group bacterium]|nr:hypothetical protein [Patescibacteria group bacterium]
MRNLTLKQKCVLDLEARGIDRNDAVLQCYNAKDRANAYQIGFKLGKNELYQKELKKQKDLVELIKLDEGKKFADILRSLISPTEVASILKGLIESGDTRAKLQAVQEYNKVLSHYPREDKALIDLGSLNITMSAPKEKEQIEQGEVIEQKNGTKKKNKEET